MPELDHDNTVEIVVSHKRTPGSVKRKTVKVLVSQSSSLSLFGVLNYLPDRPNGDTDDTMEDMIEVMNIENRKQKRNRDCLSELMAQTFADRRKNIVTNQLSISELRDCFPCLFDRDQACSLNYNPSWVYLLHVQFERLLF